MQYYDIRKSKRPPTEKAELIAKRAIMTLMKNMKNNRAKTELICEFGEPVEIEETNTRNLLKISKNTGTMVKRVGVDRPRRYFGGIVIFFLQSEHYFWNLEFRNIIL